MSYLNHDAPRIGTVATLKPYRRIDSRECRKCGAVAGRCQHLAADEDIIWIARGKERPLNPAHAWTAKEREQVKRLFIDHGLTSTQIAEIMNTTRSAISGLLRREGVARGGV